MINFLINKYFPLQLSITVKGTVGRYVGMGFGAGILFTKWVILTCGQQYWPQISHLKLWLNQYDKDTFACKSAMY